MQVIGEHCATRRQLKTANYIHRAPGVCVSTCSVCSESCVALWLRHRRLGAASQVESTSHKTRPRFPWPSIRGSPESGARLLSSMTFRRRLRRWLTRPWPDDAPSLLLDSQGMTEDANPLSTDLHRANLRATQLAAAEEAAVTRGSALARQRQRGLVATEAAGDATASESAGNAGCTSPPRERLSVHRSPLWSARRSRSSSRLFPLVVLPQSAEAPQTDSNCQVGQIQLISMATSPRGQSQSRQPDAAAHQSKRLPGKK